MALSVGGAAEPTGLAARKALASADPAPAAGLVAPADPSLGNGDPTERVPALGGPDPRRPSEPAALEGYVWPLPHGRLTQPFGPSPWGSLLVNGKLFHDGVDLATFCGDRVVAAHAGVVLAAGYHYDSYLGWIGDLSRYFARLDAKGLWTTLPMVVVIDDGNGYRSIYAHFERINVRAGQTVRAGQLLGLEGMSGHATGCHLHYGLFSPMETDAFELDPDVVRPLLLPGYEIARIDPLKVLPHRADLGTPSPAPASPSPAVIDRFE